MIIVTGSFTAKEGALAEALVHSLTHVRRSRLEPGCVSHAVHQDAENPNRLVFVEEWTDLAALQTHIALPASREFGKALAGLAAVKPTMQVFEAAALSF